MAVVVLVVQDKALGEEQVWRGFAVPGGGGGEGARVPAEPPG